MEASGVAHNGVYRLACERCRKQKLGCQWSKKNPGHACDRCANAGVLCETNTGRPPRHRLHSLSQDTPGSPNALGTTRPGLIVAAYRRDLRPFTATSAAAPSPPPPQPHAQQSQSFAPAPAPASLTLHGTHAALSGVLSPDFAMDFNGGDPWLEQAEASASCLAIATHGQDPTAGHDDHFQLVGAAENETLYESSLSDDEGLPDVPPASTPATTLPTSVSGDLPATGAPSGQPDINSAGPDDYQVQLAQLLAVLFAMPPNSNARQTTQDGLWTLLLPPIVAHMKTFQGILSRAATAAAAAAAAASDTTYEDSGEFTKAERPVVDSSEWLLQLSCFTRVIQICRLLLASLRRSLETNSGLVRDMILESTMMQEDEPGLKVFVLVQILSYRIDALAVAMNLPEHHCVHCAVPASSASTRLTSSQSIPTSTTDSILEERSVFGAIDDRKRTILEAFRTECEALVALAAYN